MNYNRLDLSTAVQFKHQSVKIKTDASAHTWILAFVESCILSLFPTATDPSVI